MYEYILLAAIGGVMKLGRSPLRKHLFLSDVLGREKLLLLVLEALLWALRCLAP